jgi:hypothetical protein
MFTHVLIFQRETDGEILLVEAKAAGLKAHIERMKKRGFTRWDCAIIKGEIVKSFNSNWPENL